MSLRYFTLLHEPENPQSDEAIDCSHEQKGRRAPRVIGGDASMNPLMGFAIWFSVNNVLASSTSPTPFGKKCPLARSSVYLAAGYVGDEIAAPGGSIASWQASRQAG